MQRFTPACLLSCLALLISATGAVGATTRYAAPKGSGPEPCAQEAPCSLFAAADSSSGIQPGDEVVVEPGSYIDDDLGPARSIALPPGVFFHGRAGAPRPVITIINEARQEFAPGLTAAMGDTVSHVLINTNIPFPFGGSGALIEDVIARSTHPEATVCGLGGGTIIRSSACLSTGFQAIALGTNSIISANQSVDLRNVTAISEGEESFGIYFNISASSTAPGSNFAVTATNVIARGGLADVAATAITGASVEVLLDHSDYVSTRTSTDPNGISATVSPTGEGTTNLTAEPLFSRDGYHQVAGSPTIDTGVADPLSGAFDIDGETRVFGAAADIGADEWAQPPEEDDEEERRPGPGGGPPPVPAPQTIFLRHPGKRTAAHLARFYFVSDLEDASFECKLDGRRFLRCGSHLKVLVKGGTHILFVRAVDEKGIFDPTPAIFRWQVSAKKRG